MGGQKWKRPFWGGRRARFGGNRAKWGHWGWPMMWVCLPQCQGVDATQGAIFLPGGAEGGDRRGVSKSNSCETSGFQALQYAPFLPRAARIPSAGCPSR